MQFEPTTSYGIILLHIDANEKQIRYLLSQRRDTIEYSDYLKGRYNSYNLQTYFGLMTEEERDRLVNYTFDELWDDLWIDHSNSYYKNYKGKSKTKYENNKTGMYDLLKKTFTLRKEPSWGFPKGKKNFQENEINCAFREFEEETCLKINYTNLLNISPSIEIFKGSNNYMYKTVYYIAQTDIKFPINKLKLETGIREYTISDEVSNLRWCTLGEALVLLQPYRQKLLIETELKVRRHLSDIFFHKD